MGLSGASPASGDQIAEFNTLQGGGAAPNLSQPFLKTTTAIPDTTPTTVATLSVPNLDSSASIEVLVRSMITASGHNADSTRVVKYLIAVTRKAGAAAVAAISAAIGAAIATNGGGSTLTTALTIAAVSGAVGAVNTFALQIANVGTPSGISETSIEVTILNGSGGQVTVS
jgi:hypothetical protein